MIVKGKTIKLTMHMSKKSVDAVRKEFSGFKIAKQVLNPDRGLLMRFARANARWLKESLKKQLNIEAQPPLTCLQWQIRIQKTLQARYQKDRILSKTCN